MYGKVFESIYDGTLAGHWQAIVTMQQLIVLANEDGVVDMTPKAIARRTTIPLKIIAAGLEHLADPDPYSRTPGEEGRRIVLLDDHRPWGWRLVNFSKYRGLRNMEQKREADRQRVAEKRKKNKDVATVSQGVANVAHADTDAEALNPPIAPPEGQRGSKGNGEHRARKKSATRAPDSFEIAEPMWAWAQEQGVPHERIETETAKFLDHHKAKGTTFSDWPAAWRKWMRNVVEFAAARAH